MTAPVHPGGERPGTFAERHVSILRSALLDYQADWHANIANDPEGSAVQIESAQELLDALPVAERSNAVPDLMDMLRRSVDKAKVDRAMRPVTELLRWATSHSASAGDDELIAAAELAVASLARSGGA